MLRMNLTAVTVIPAALLLLAAGAPVVSSAPSYFGEPSPHLDPNTVRRVEAGRAFFVKFWDDGNETRRNKSCLSCHEVPMPGGSGIHSSTFVRVEIDEAHPTGFRMVDPAVPRHSTGETLNLKPPALFGLGLVENVECSGRCPQGAIGYRNCLKTIDEFVSVAFESELGVRVKRHPDPAKNEISPEQIAMVAEFIRYLAPPPVVEDATAKEGGEIFNTIGCAACHTQERMTRSSSPSAIRRARFQPLSDFVEHRVRGDRNYGLRTAPLWGLTYTGPPYLHDGSARTLEEAIVAHQGEAANVTKRYQTLPAADRKLLIRYLKSR